MTADLQALADTFEANGNPFVFSPEGKAIADLDYNVGCALSHILHIRKTRRAVEAFDTTPAIRAYMLAALDKDLRGCRAPEACDATHFAKASQRTTSQYGKPRPAYQPKGDCALRLSLAKAVRFTYCQDSYADMSTTLVPVSGDVAKADLKACAANLSEFVRYADSHTGMAGSGCNYSAELVTNEHGAFAIIGCRASISD